MKLFVLLLLLSSESWGQKMDWGKSRDWKLYDIHTNKAFAYSSDTLQNFKCIELPQDSMQTFLKELTEISKDDSPVWMGLYVATCKLEDGLLRKIDISVYGGFFYDENSKTYFQLQKIFSDNWLNYLREKGTELQLSIH
jgi:hypothetical protein